MKHLRILQLNYSSSAIGGTERNLIEYADQFTKLGHYVLTCSLHKKQGDLADELIRRNLPFLSLGFSFPWKLHRLLDLVKLVHQNHFDVINIYGFKITVLTTLLLKLSGSHVIVSGLDGTDDWRRPYHVALESFAYPFIGGWIAVSNNVKEVFMKRERIVGEKIKVIHCAVNTNILSPRLKEKSAEIRARLKISPDIFIIGNTSVIKPFKGHVDILKALRMLKDKNVRFKCIFVGKDHLHGKIQAIATKLGLKDDIIFTGFVENLYDIVPVFDLYVSASLVEGLSVAMLEAMALGLPIIVTPVGGTLEVVNDGENGLITRVKKPTILFEKIFELVNNPVKRKMLGDNASKKIRKEFSLETKVQEKLNYFYSLLKK